MYKNKLLSLFTVFLFSFLNILSPKAFSFEISTSEDDKVCIASFVPESEIYIQVLKEKSKGIANIYWFESPVPKDIYTENLRLGGCTEIILIFHSIKINSNLKVYSYTRPVHETATNIKTSNQPSYIPLTPILNFPFERLLEQLSEKTSDSYFNKLRRLRIVACDAEAVSANYPSIQRLKEKLGVSLEFSSISQLLSLFYGDNVSAPNIESISESFQFESASNSYFYSYLTLISPIFGSYGESDTLRNKYSISVQSISIGIGKITTKIYIPFNEVKNLKINEEKTIIVPRVGLNFALLALKVNSNIAPKPFLIISDEFDSIGATIDFFAFIKIRRNY